MWGCLEGEAETTLVYSCSPWPPHLLSVFTNWPTMDLFWPTAVQIYNSTASSFHQKKVKVTQSYLTLLEPIDCSSPGHSVHRIFHSRILEWIAISLSKESSPPRDQTWVSHTAGWFSTNWATREWQISPVFLPQEPHSVIRQKDITLEDEPPRSEGVQWATGEGQRAITNSSRKNEEAGSK